MKKQIRSAKGALKRARELWGERACVEDRGKAVVVNERVLHRRYCVGRVMLGMFFEVLGEGESWDDAFTAYHESKAREKERIDKLRAERTATP